MIDADLYEKLKNYEGADAVIDSFEMQKLLKEESDARVILSKITSLDNYLEGFEGGELIAVSGPRKSGKTLFCQSITYNLNDQDVHPLWFNFENTPKVFYRVFEGAGLPFFTQPKILKANAMWWIETKIAESLVKFGTGVVFIDHLHFLLDMEQIKNPSMEIGTIIRKLKLICLEHKIVIFILCHMNKNLRGEEPGDSDIRDSSFIAQESDVGLVVYRTKREQDTTWLKVCYSRRTGVFEKKIKLQKINGFLREPDEQHTEEQGNNLSSKDRVMGYKDRDSF